MGGPRENVDDAVIDEATQWFTLLWSDAATDDDRRAFEAWRDADPRHAAAYEQTLGVWKDVGELDDLEALACDTDFGRLRRFSPGRLSALFGRFFSPRLAYAGIVVTALAIAMVVMLQPAWLLPDVYATRIAETARVTAPDGSVIDLGAESKMRIAFSGAERRIYLKEGEAFFDVRKGDARAFIVMSGEAEIRVTGTKFNVRQGPAGVTVAVAEGAVALRRKMEVKEIGVDDSAALKLSAGQQAAANDGLGLTEVIETPPAKVGAWRTGHLHYSNATLRDVIADANRYSAVPIIVADERLLDMKLVAAFRTDQIDAMIDGLPEILPLTADRSSKGRVVLRVRGEGGE